MRDVASCTLPSNRLLGSQFRAEHPPSASAHVPILPPHSYR